MCLVVVGGVVFVSVVVVAVAVDDVLAVMVLDTDGGDR